jgi:hypothetical protein
VKVSAPGGSWSVDRSKLRVLPRLLDGVAGSLLLGFGVLLLGGNLLSGMAGGYQIDAGEAEFLGLMAVLCSWGTFLLYLAVRTDKTGG